MSVHPGERVFLPVLILITDRNVRAPGMSVHNPPRIQGKVRMTSNS